MPVTARPIRFLKHTASALMLGALLAGTAAIADSTPASAGVRFGGGWHHGGWGWRGGWHASWGWHGGWGWRGGWHAGWGWHGGCGCAGWRRAHWGEWGPGYGYVYPYPVTYSYPQVAVAPAGHAFTVYFQFNNYDLTPEGTAEIDRAIADAQRGAPSQIAVIGNTDRAGGDRYNLELSQRRAETVADYMVAHGVPHDAIHIRALGESDPGVPTPDGVRDPRNRRVVIVVSPQGAPPTAGMSGPQMGHHPPQGSIPNRNDAMHAIAPANAPPPPPPGETAPTPVNASPAPPPANQPAAPPPQSGQPTNLVNPQQ